MTAGNRAIWFNRQYPDAVYVDARAEVHPDFIVDSKSLPAEIGDGFDLIVFDPPHKTNGGQFGMARSYGTATMPEIYELVKGGAREAHRVSKPNALMAFKWNDHHRDLEAVLAMMQNYWEPLFGHGLREQQRRGSQTSWVMLRRVSAP